MKRCILFFLGAICFSCLSTSVYSQRIDVMDRNAREATSISPLWYGQQPAADFDQRVFWVSSPDSESDKVKFVKYLSEVVPLPPSGDIHDLPEDVYFISAKTRTGKPIRRH